MKSRRQFLRATAALGTGIGISGAAQAEFVVTPPHTEGPFYPTVEQDDKDADLTRISGRDGVAEGEVISVSGRVLDELGEPIPAAIVDVWQANAAGRYAHERDPNPAPLDPNFQGWAILSADAEGRFAFQTVKPGAYPVSNNWTRPPHIHFKVSRRGYHEITTQMYFAGEPLNDIDRLLNALPKDLRSSLIAQPAEGDARYRFDVVLASA